MAPLAFAGGQHDADLAQRLRLPELAKQHGNELTPTGETTGVTFGGMLLHRAFKIMAGKELEKLRENGAYSIQGGIPPERIGFAKNSIQASRDSARFLNRNLDKLGAGPVSTRSKRRGKPRLTERDRGRSSPTSHRCVSSGTLECRYPPPGSWEGPTASHRAKSHRRATRYPSPVPERLPARDLARRPIPVQKLDRARPPV